MSNTTLQPVAGRLSFWGVVRSEWLKMRSLLSQKILFFICIGLLLGLTLLFALIHKSIIDSQLKAVRALNDSANSSIKEGIISSYQDGNLYSVSSSSSSFFLAMLVASMATVFIASEYATGSIQTSLVAVPRRGTLYLAKTIVVSIFAFLMGFVGSLIGFFLAMPILGEYAPGFNAGALRLCLMFGFCLVVFTWMGLGFGALLRNSAGGIMMSVSIIFIIPALVGIVGGVSGSIESLKWILNFILSLPQDMMNSILTYKTETIKDPSYEVRCVLFTLWGLVPLVLGWVRFQFSDNK